MEKYALAVLLLVPLVFADVSQEDAGNLCKPYSLEAESVVVSGPIACEGEYWVCKFYYYGNKQNVIAMVGKVDGRVVSPDEGIIRDLISTDYASGSSSYIFDSFLSDSVFSIQMRGMNSTLTNYLGVLKSLLDEGQIERSVYADFRERINGLKSMSLELADETEDLHNVSVEFWDSPDCVELLRYMEDLNRTLGLAGEFSTAWNEFIGRYNTLAEGLEAYVATINPSNAQVMAQNVAYIEASLEDYREDEEGYVSTVMENLRTRFERKEIQDRIDDAYGTVEGSANPEARDKYREALDAFSEGRYSDARRLVKEALALAPIEPYEPPPTTVREEPDLTPYLIAVGVLVAAVAVLMALRKMREEGEEEEEEKPKKGKKAEKKGKWEWSRGGGSALESA